MRDKIRKRIEAVRRGEVPEGYRKSGPYLIPAGWEIERLGNMSECKSRPNRDGKERPIYSVTNRDGFVPQSEQFEKGSYQDLDKSTYKVVKRGEFAYNPARVNVGSIGRLCEVDEAAVSSLYVCISLDERLDGAFFDCWTKTQDFQREISRNLEGSVREYLFYENFSNIRMPLPPVREQQKIADILAACDRVIELKQTRVEELKQLKKTCLAKMFPREGEDVPELRFPGFTAPWEQRKVGDLAQFSKGTGYSKSDLKESGTPIILYGRLYTKYETVIADVDTFANAKTGSVYSRGGEVIVPASGETAEDISIASVVEKPGVLLGGDLNIITPLGDLDSTFLAISITNGKPHSDMAKMAQGKSVVHLHNTDLEKINLSYPSHKEQLQISAFFRHIDTLITLHQRELEAEQQKKKALMQLLLTGLVRV